MAVGQQTLSHVVVPESGSDEERPVLVAATPTDRGQRALAAGCAVARRLGLPLHAYQILQSDEFGGRGETTLDDLARHVRESASTPASAHVACFPEHYVDEEYGRAAALVDAATRSGAKLIVIGRHAAGASKKPLTGTMTNRLLQYTPCPVLIAANDPPRPYRKVVVAADFSPISFKAVRAAIEFAPGADITVVHAVDEKSNKPARDSSGGMDSIENLIEVVIHEAPRNTDCHFEPKVVSGPPGQALAACVSEMQPDLLVLGTKGRTGLARIILGSIAARFVDDPPCDLLLLKSPD